MNRILAIVVLYNPSNEILEKWKAYVLRHSQVFFYFVDNSQFFAKVANTENSIYYGCQSNLGIAAAQNIGIKYAIENDYSYSIFFDQDSEIDGNFIQDLVREFDCIRKKNNQIVILGPRVINKDSLQEYKHRENMVDGAYAIASHLISSGSIVNVDVFKDVGLMNEKMFIDYVDFEWCWRVQRKGYLCGKASNVFMKHKVGQNMVSFLGVPVVFSAPIRYFYQYRNFLWLLRCCYVPLKWKMKMLLRKIVEPLFLVTFVDKRKEVLVNIMRGIISGMNNKMNFE